MRVLHLSARAPFARHIHSSGIEIVNGLDNSQMVPRDTTFKWLNQFLKTVQGAYDCFDVLHIHTVELLDFSIFEETLDLCVKARKGLLFTYHDTHPMFSKDTESFKNCLNALSSYNAVFTTLTNSARNILSAEIGISLEQICVNTKTA